MAVETPPAVLYEIEVDWSSPPSAPGTRVRHTNVWALLGAAVAAFATLSMFYNSFFDEPHATWIRLLGLLGSLVLLAVTVSLLVYGLRGTLRLSAPAADDNGFLSPLSPKERVAVSNVNPLIYAVIAEEKRPDTEVRMSSSYRITPSSWSCSGSSTSMTSND